MTSLLLPPDVPDPAPAEALAVRLLEFSEVLTDTARRLATVHAEWQGDAALSFDAVKSLQPPRFDDAASALVVLARALAAYAESLSGIRSRLDTARHGPPVVDRGMAEQRARSDVAAAEARCVAALNAAAAQAPGPPVPGRFMRTLARVFTPLRMPDSVRTDDGLTGLFGGVGDEFVHLADSFEAPWTELPVLSEAIRRAGGVPDPAPASTRFQLGGLAADIATAGVGGGSDPEALEAGTERVLDLALLRRDLGEDAFAGDPPRGLLDRISYRRKWSSYAVDGHAWERHALGLGRNHGPDLAFTSKREFRRWAHTVMKQGEMRHGLPRRGEDPADPAEPWLDRTAYWHDGTILIVDPRNPDKGTMFVPSSGRAYFEENFR